MIRSKTILEIKNEKRTFEFLCEQDSPLGEVYDALSAMRNYIVQRIQENEKKPEESTDACQS